MRKSVARTRCGATLALVLVLAGCGGSGVPGGVTIVQPADGPDGQQGKGGKGGKGGSAGPGGVDGNDGVGGLAKVDSALAQCMARNDALFPTTSSALDEYWQSRGAQRVFGRIQEALEFGDYPNPKTVLERGLIDVGASSPESRVVVIVDPRVVDREKLSRRLNKLSRQVYRDEKVTGPQVRVDVQEGCFSAHDLDEVMQYVRKNRSMQGAVSSGSGPGLDSRVHWTFYDDARDRGAALEQKFGPKVAVSYVARPTSLF